MAKLEAIVALTPARLRFASRWLAKRDSSLQRVLTEHGYPDMWAREPGFSTTVHIILEQQVSLASANATFSRLKLKLDGLVTAEGLLKLTELELKGLGLTRQKIRYTRLLAEKVTSGAFAFESLTSLQDDLARTAMTAHKGIGNWTADIYLSECLLRCDILPKGDVGVQEAFRVLKGLEKRPTCEQLEAMTEHWQPWRSVATRMLWKFYLNQLTR
ncbi:MAG: DNA-3-methyladenine glycosylase 2 family protein [Planctomycetota bacterium]|nr:DNA-3-methyladenine glycosylase 2 family protein [Planctomycetota bacterium]